MRSVRLGKALRSHPREGGEGRVRLRYGDPEEPAWVISGELSSADDWRGMVELLAPEYCPEPDMDVEEILRCHEIYFDHKPSMALELMALAMIGDGPCLPGIGLLSHASDAQLAGLRARYGSFLAPAFLRFLERLVWIDGRTEDRLADVFDRLRMSDALLTPSSIARGVRLLRHVLRAEEHRAEARETLRRAERRWKVFPLERAIDALVEAWAESQECPRNWMEDLGHRARRDALRAYLEEHVLEHGRLPTGTVRIAPKPASGPMRGTPSPFEIDFDELNRRAGFPEADTGSGPEIRLEPRHSRRK